jgi:serine/threonine-protein kinase
VTDQDIERRALEALERLLDLPEDARRAELARLDAEDAALAVAVRRLLAHDDSVTDWMPTEAPGLWAAENDRIPERIGPFAIRGVLGRGGMGVVLRGERDDGLFDQTVAIKLVRGALASLHQRERFILERQILARLDDPAIARILDGGVWEDSPFFIMDFVDGIGLAEHAAANGLDLAARLHLFLQVCRAVQYAHRQLIVHADLKPSNIMVTPAGQVKLLDFGIARIIGDDGVAIGPSSSGKSGTGSITLTRAYAAPERRAGARPTIEGDVFSLGAILYELLAGRIATPDEATSTWPLASLTKGLAPSRAAELEGDLDAILARALAHDPANRYPDVAALVADIEAWQHHYPVTARPLGAFERTRRFVQRHRRGLALTAIVGVILVASAVFATFQAIRAERARDIAERRFADIRGLDRSLNEGYDALARLPGTVPQRVRLAENAAATLARLQLTGDAPADIRVDAARNWRRLAEILAYPATSNLGEPERGLAALARSEALLAEVVADRPRDAEALTELGWTRADRWTLSPDTKDSLRLIDQAQADFDRALAIQPDAPSARLGQFALERARAYQRIWADNKPGTAIAPLNAALAGLRAIRWPAAFAPRVAALEITLLNQLGDATYYAGDVPGALAPYTQADTVADREIALRGETPTLAIVKTLADYNLSGTLGELPRRSTEALKRARAGSARMEALLDSGPDASAEKLLLMTYGQEGVVLETIGKFAEARAVAAKGNAIRERRLDRQPAHYQAIRDMAIGLLQSGRLEDLAGQADAACATATRAIALFDRLKSMKALSEFDATNEMPKAIALRAKSCR